MAGKAPPPKAASPPWLQHAGARQDEFRLQARFADASLEPPPPGPDGQDQLRRDRVAAAKHGLSFDSVKAKSSAGAFVAQSEAYKHMAAASFAPERHIFFVLGRPCVVLSECVMVAPAIFSTKLEPTAEHLAIHGVFPF